MRVYQPEPGNYLIINPTFQGRCLICLEIVKVTLERTERISLEADEVYEVEEHLKEETEAAE